MMANRRDGELRRGNATPPSRSLRITMAVAVGIILGCVFTLLFPEGFFLRRAPSSEENLDVGSSLVHKERPCEQGTPEVMDILKSEFSSMSERNSELENRVKDLSSKLQLAEQRRDRAENDLLTSGKLQKVGPFGTVKAPRTTAPGVLRDESVNPTLAKLLQEVAVNDELVVALANADVEDELRLWHEGILRVGIRNHLVVALDDRIESVCRENNVSFYRRRVPGDDDVERSVDRIGRNGTNHQVSGLKFHLLREFLQLGYGVLLSDVDVVYLRNPFDHLHRDSDMESMSDGYTEATAYGFDDVHDDPSMGWARSAHTVRIWVYNSGFFYVRPTLASVELLDRVFGRLLRSGEEVWDQAVFNEELFYPSRPGYQGLHASKRTMDMYLFMNSKVLFRFLRHEGRIFEVNPVVVHVNYHPDKLERMKAVIQFFVDGRQDALKPFPDGSE